MSEFVDEGILNIELLIGPWPNNNGIVAGTCSGEDSRRNRLCISSLDAEAHGSACSELARWLSL